MFLVLSSKQPLEIFKDASLYERPKMKKHFVVVEGRGGESEKERM